MKPYLFLLIILFLFSCHSENETFDNDVNKGKIIGYLKCKDNEGNKNIFGLFIISNKKDSLLSFNITPSYFDLDSSLLQYGIGFLNGDSIFINYRNANEGELKYFDCPPSTMQNPTFYPIDDFTQIIVTDIKKIKLSNDENH